MRHTPRFDADAAAIAQLVRSHPLALLVSRAGGSLTATPVPMLLRPREDQGEELVGHLARANPQVAALREDPDALVVFTGPSGYVSPSWMRDRTQAPTWNYATVHFWVRVELLPAQEARAAVVELTEAMERGRPSAWGTSELGERFEKLLPGVVAFRARIVRTHATFKLGQNERVDVLQDILEGLEAQGSTELATMMRLANQARLEGGARG